MKSLLDNLEKNPSVLQEAVAIQAEVAKVGFDWPTLQEVMQKLHEETDELAAEIQANADRAKMLDELGDVLFVCANIARWLQVDPEAALAHANQKFATRFRMVEKMLAERNTSFEKLSFAEMLDLWEEVKHLLKRQNNSVITN